MFSHNRDKRDKVAELTVENQRDLNTPQIEVASHDISFIRYPLCDPTSPEALDFMGVDQDNNLLEQNSNYPQDFQPLQSTSQTDSQPNLVSSNVNIGGFNEAGKDPTATNSKRKMDMESKLHDAICDHDLTTLSDLLRDSEKSPNVWDFCKEDLLCHAVLVGSLEVIKVLLEKMVVDVDAKNSKGNTPLHVAASRNNLETVEALSERRENVDAENSDGYTPLHSAALKDNEDSSEIVKALLEYEANVNAENSDGYAPFHSAALQSKGKVAQLLLEYEANVNAENPERDTPLHLAASEGNLEVVKALLEHGANVNTENSDGYAPLHLAASEGNLEVVKLLLEHGANVNAESSDGYTPLSIAKHCSHVEIITFLQQFKEKLSKTAHKLKNRTPRGSYSGASREASYFRDQQPYNLDGSDQIPMNVNIGASFRDITLSESLLPETMKWCLDIRESHPPLNEGIMDLHYDQIDTGASGSASQVNNQHSNLSQHQPYQESAEASSHDQYHLANAVKNHEELHITVQKSSLNESISLYGAVLQGNVKVVKTLLEKGANVNEKNINGSTPLHLAASEGNLEVVKLLLEHGANVNAESSDGYTPLSIAKHCSHMEIITLLQQFKEKLSKTAHELKNRTLCGSYSGASREAFYFRDQQPYNFDGGDQVPTNVNVEVSFSRLGSLDTTLSESLLPETMKWCLDIRESHPPLNEGIMDLHYDQIDTGASGSASQVDSQHSNLGQHQPYQGSTEASHSYGALQEFGGSLCDPNSIFIKYHQESAQKSPEAPFSCSKVSKKSAHKLKNRASRNLHSNQANMGASESVGQTDNRLDSRLSDVNVHRSGTSRQNY